MPETDLIYNLFAISLMRFYGQDNFFTPVRWLKTAGFFSSAAGGMRYQ